MENTKPLISVIINCYNGEKYLREAIDSVVNQTYKNWEIVFWDNWSTDSSAEIVKSYKNDKIHYFYAPKHTPLGEARNLAMKCIIGELFSFLDTDDIWTPDFLSIAVSALIEDITIVGFYSNYYNYYIEKQNKKVENNRNWKSGIHDLKFVVSNYGIAMSGCVLRANVASKNRISFDNHFHLVEDMDFFLSFLQFGTFFYDSRVLAYYRVYSNNNSHKLQDKWAFEYETLLDKIRKRNISNPILTEEDLRMIKIMVLSNKMENCIKNVNRKELYNILVQNWNVLPFRYCWSRIVYLLFGRRSYSIIQFFKSII